MDARARDASPSALYPLQEIGGLEVRVAIPSLAHLGASREQRVGLVEEEQRRLVSCSRPQPSSLS